MSDLIYRGDAIDACLDDCCACVYDCVDKIEKLPSAEPEASLETVAVYTDGIRVGTGMLDRKRQLLFSGYITCEMAKKRGFVWVTAEEDK